MEKRNKQKKKIEYSSIWAFCLIYLIVGLVKISFVGSFIFISGFYARGFLLLLGLWMFYGGLKDMRERLGYVQENL